MSKVKYYYDTKTLSYKRIEKNGVYRFKQAGVFIASAALFAFIIVILAFRFFDSPKEKRLKREIENMALQYKVLDEQMDQIQVVLEDIQKRDDNIYRTIFEADPIPSSIRKAGFGGINQYENISGYPNSKLVKQTTIRLDQIKKQVYVQSKSFDDVIELAKNKSELLAAIPAIQPVSNEDLTRMASGYGMRIHPIYKTRKMHYGMDFTAPTGTPIYATGNGKVVRADSKASGFGRHIRIDHGYGYTTLYAHLNDYNVRVGQQVKRGEVIGFVGNSGQSKGPHCHYEVHKNGDRINPVNFYYDDLSPLEYDEMLQMATQENESFD